MLEVDVPGWRTLRLEHLVLDVNGTLTLDGTLLPIVAPKLTVLGAQLEVQLLSADTFGRLDDVAAALAVVGRRLRAGEPESAQKAQVVRELGAESVVAIGNGANDVAMLAEAALGIAVLGPEGLAVASLTATDVIVASIEDALELLLNPMRLIATLRR